MVLVNNDGFQHLYEIYLKLLSLFQGPCRVLVFNDLCPHGRAFFRPSIRILLKFSDWNFLRIQPVHFIGCETV